MGHLLNVGVSGSYPEETQKKLQTPPMPAKKHCRLQGCVSYLVARELALLRVLTIRISIHKYSRSSLTFVLSPSAVNLLQSSCTRGAKGGAAGALHLEALCASGAVHEAD